MPAAALKLAEPQPDPSLSDLAREMLAGAGGIRSEACDALEKRLANDARLRRIVADEAIDIALAAMVTRAHLNSRGSILRAVGAGREGVRSLATGMLRGVLDMPLLDGTSLRDAGPDQLRAAIDHYRRQAVGMNRMAKFLAAVLKDVPDGGTVGDVLDESAANTLWRKFQK